MNEGGDRVDTEVVSGSKETPRVNVGVSETERSRPADATREVVFDVGDLSVYYGSFRADECGTSLDGSCPVIDKLFGSRMVLANLELRFPLWGAFGGDNFYGPLPIELGVFTDAGAAWDRSGSLKLTGTAGKLVPSGGALVRANLLGFAIAEIDYVRPIDRPDRGWLWSFNLRPGF